MIRLILLSILLLFSLLTVFRAPEFHLWLAAIVVTEFCWIFILLTLLLLFAGFWPGNYRVPASIVGIAALFLFLTPLVQAKLIAHQLPQNLAGAFGRTPSSSAEQETSPFRLKYMLVNETHPQVPYQTYPFATYPDTALTFDFYASQFNGRRPCVLVIHGGSWKSGDSKQLPELNSYLAKNGYHVAAINYRLAPKYKGPDAIEDVKNALSYLKKHAAELKIDTGNFVILGRSAGAQIGLLAAYTIRDPDIKGVIDFYGPADMVWGYSIPSNPLIMDSRKVMSDYLGGTYAQVPQKFADSSPLLAAEQYSIPTLIIHGENDVLVSPIHSQRLDSLLAKKHIPHYLLKMPWATHGFDYNLNGPGGQLSTYAVGKFLQAVTQI